ncbi:MAG: penicillin-binding protein 2, partial [Chlamydiia bacterium]|nr:penicillin-binding protein 2 [Chlamydiia bacterium]
GKLLGQVLHTVQRQRDEKTKQAIPTGGLELYFDRELSGTVGKRRLLRSPLNALETGEVIAYPQHGADIYLTINHTLQAITEEELEKGVKKAKAKAGWAVMMEPQNGHILALAQYPFFDPSDYPTYFAHANLTEHTQVKAVTEAPEPGSSFKPITLAIALLANQELRERGEKELFHPDEKIATASGKFPGRSRPISDVGNHKFLNMQMGLQKSSNIYMARLVERIIQRLGDDWYRSTLCERFGLGEKTGIELPSESAGLIPRPGKKHPNGALEWSVPTPFSLAMGHNLQTNAIQFVRAMAVFANGGYLVQPTLIKKIVHGSEVVEKSPKKRQILSKEIVDQVVTAMKFATKKGGTARRADVSGYTEAGKSGTGEKAVAGGYARKTVCSNFIGFTPAKDPAFILLVVIDEPEHHFIPGVGGNHHGGLCAAPVFREIARRSLDYLGIPPDDPHGYPPGDPRYDPDKADWLPEVRKLQEKYNAWNF